MTMQESCAYHWTGLSLIESPLHPILLHLSETPYVTCFTSACMPSSLTCKFFPVPWLGSYAFAVTALSIHESLCLTPFVRSRPSSTLNCGLQLLTTCVRVGRGDALGDYCSESRCTGKNIADVPMFEIVIVVLMSATAHKRWPIRTLGAEDVAECSDFGVHHMPRGLISFTRSSLCRRS
jgi:hypothetical protein